MRIIIQLLQLAHHFRNQQRHCQFLVGLKTCTRKSLKYKKLLSPEVQVQVRDECSELKISFEHFQSKLRQLIGEAKCKKGSITNQLTLHHMFENYLH